MNNKLSKKEIKNLKKNKKELSEYAIKEISKKLETKFIDPPSGWKYGFPRPYNEKKDGDLKTFLKNSGYPEKDIDFASEHCRMWYEEIEQ